MKTWIRGSSGLIWPCAHWETVPHWQSFSHLLVSGRTEALWKQASTKGVWRELRPDDGPPTWDTGKDNLPFVSVWAWVKLNSHKLLLQLSPYLDVKCYSLISHPQQQHPFLPRGYRLWRGWLSRICCRSFTHPFSSGKAMFAALQRAVSHGGIASRVRDKDGGGGSDWQNGKCKHRRPPGNFSFDICLFSAFVFVFTAGWCGDSFPCFFFLSSSHSFLQTSPLWKNPSIPLCNHSCLLCPVGNCCPIHKSW